MDTQFLLNLAPVYALAIAMAILTLASLSLANSFLSEMCCLDPSGDNKFKYRGPIYEDFRKELRKFAETMRYSFRVLGLIFVASVAFFLTFRFDENGQVIKIVDLPECLSNLLLPIAESGIFFFLIYPLLLLNIFVIVGRITRFYRLMAEFRTNQIILT